MTPSGRDPHPHDDAAVGVRAAGQVELGLADHAVAAHLPGEVAQLVVDELAVADQPVGDGRRRGLDDGVGGVDDDGDRAQDREHVADPAGQRRVGRARAVGEAALGPPGRDDADGPDDQARRPTEGRRDRRIHDVRVRRRERPPRATGGARAQPVVRSSPRRCLRFIPACHRSRRRRGRRPPSRALSHPSRRTPSRDAQGLPRRARPDRREPRRDDPPRGVRDDPRDDRPPRRGRAPRRLRHRRRRRDRRDARADRPALLRPHRPPAAGGHRPAGRRHEHADEQRHRADGRPGPARRQGRPAALPRLRRAAGAARHVPRDGPGRRAHRREVRLGHRRPRRRGRPGDRAGRRRDGQPAPPPLRARDEQGLAARHRDGGRHHPPRPLLRAVRRPRRLGRRAGRLDRHRRVGQRGQRQPRGRRGRLALRPCAEARPGRLFGPPPMGRTAR